MTFIQKFHDHIKSTRLFSTGAKLLLAVSGGVDSVVLCELCKQAGFDFEIAHCNFRLRGEESDRDEKFVRDLAAKYQVKVHVKGFDTEKYAAEKKLSIQEAARELRYTWFAELVKTPDSRLPAPDFLVTAHHADDNAETIAMNFFRGTGLHGLTGMPASAGYLKRPLLNFSKEEILDFVRENKLEFVEDSSNQSSRYTRNFFRNEILPAISTVYPEVNSNLQDNIERFRETEKLYRLAVDKIKQKLYKQKGNEFHYPVKQVMGFDSRALIYDIIAPFGFQEKQVDEFIKLAGSDSGKFIESPDHSHRVIKHRYWFIIAPKTGQEVENIIIEESDQYVSFPEGTLTLETITDSRFTIHDSPPLEACLDRSNLEFPLLLRKWKSGDYFYPLGMKKKKKVARFLIDLKLSKTAKEKTWVIESNKRIVWVLNHRIDERFKITGKTKNLLKLTFISPRTK
jgi:tRNA(Ile)-lysidine synthase